jgi:hypothetical protein
MLCLRKKCACIFPIEITADLFPLLHKLTHFTKNGLHEIYRTMDY